MSPFEKYYTIYVQIFWFSNFKYHIFIYNTIQYILENLALTYHSVLCSCLSFCTDINIKKVSDRYRCSKRYQPSVWWHSSTSDIISLFLFNKFEIKCYFLCQHLKSHLTKQDREITLNYIKKVKSISFLLSFLFVIQIANRTVINIRCSRFDTILRSIRHSVKFWWPSSLPTYFA